MRFSQEDIESLMDYLFLLYILLCVGLGLGGTVVLIQSQRTVAGLLFLVCSVLLFTYYGLRWFSGSSLKLNALSSDTWPPIINMCPDFLSLYERKIGNTRETVCVNLVGVSRGGIQQLLDPANVANDNYVFKLHQNLKGEDRINRLCKLCSEKKVAWEGVFDGNTCMSPSYIPRSDGTKDTAKKTDSCAK